jgi:hypothetical protein
LGHSFRSVDGLFNGSPGIVTIGVYGNFLWRFSLLFKLLIDLLGCVLGDNLILDVSLALLESLGRGGDFFGRDFRLRLFVFYNLIHIVAEVTEDVIQNEVAVWLLGKNEGLDKLVMRLRFIGHLPDNLNHDVVERSLRVDIENTDFAVLEIKGLDLLADGLCSQISIVGRLC